MVKEYYFITSVFPENVVKHSGDSVNTLSIPYALYSGEKPWQPADQK